MKAKHVRILLSLTLAEGMLATIFFASRPSDPENARLFGFSYLRLGLLGVDLILLMLIAMVTFKAFRDKNWLERMMQRIARFMENSTEDSRKRLFVVQGGMVLALVAVIEAFFLTWFSIPVLTRPFIIWAALVCFQTWLVLRIVCAADYRGRPTLFAWLRSNWQLWTPVQRRIFWILSSIGLVYFLAFIPSNSSGVTVDENIVLPEIVRMLIPGATFKETLLHLFINENWSYGQPYLPLSAAALMIPRLIFGTAFVAQKQLNLLFLRQLISVLPMILSIFMLVYIVTRFKSTLRAVSMFVFLLLIPGVVRYNHRFWHPDSLILLLVVLTIFFLQRDQLRFKRDFYLAAVTCGLAVAIKLWGFFFFLTIAGYLLAGLLRKILTFKKLVLAGLVFILVMSATVVLSSPSLLVPWSYQFMVHEIQTQNQANTLGHNEPDPEGVYRTGLVNWMRYFEMFYMRNYFFYFAFFALAAGSLVGTESFLNRILLSWCLVTTIYLVTFLAVKSFWYMLPIMVPLYASVFLFPEISEDNNQSVRLTFLNKPLTRKILWAVMIGMCVSQFVFNIVSILTSPATIGILNRL